MWNITTNGKTSDLDSTDPQRYLRLQDGSELYRVFAGDKTTGTSSSPRTEKRELPGNWKYTDKDCHMLVGRFQVETAPESGKLIVGQIHAKNASAPPVKVLTLRGQLRCEVRAKPGDSKSPSVLDVPLLDENWYALVVDSKGRGQVFLNGQRAAFDLAGWKSYQLYFKQGAYSIDNDSDAAVLFTFGTYYHGGEEVFATGLIEVLSRNVHHDDPTPVPVPTPEPEPKGTFQLGDLVRKVKGSQWHGKVVGTYSTDLTPEGYAVESATEKGSVQIYPAAALEPWDGSL